MGGIDVVDPGAQQQRVGRIDISPPLDDMDDQVGRVVDGGSGNAREELGVEAHGLGDGRNGDVEAPSTKAGLPPLSRGSWRHAQKTPCAYLGHTSWLDRPLV